MQRDFVSESGIYTLYIFFSYFIFYIKYIGLETKFFYTGLNSACRTVDVLFFDGNKVDKISLHPLVQAMYEKLTKMSLGNKISVHRLFKLFSPGQRVQTGLIRASTAILFPNDRFSDRNGEKSERQFQTQIRFFGNKRRQNGNKTETKFTLKFPKSTYLSSLIKITNITNTNVLRYLFSNCTDIRHSQQHAVCSDGFACSRRNGAITGRIMSIVLVVVIRNLE